MNSPLSKTLRVNCCKTFHSSGTLCLAEFSGVELLPPIGPSSIVELFPSLEHLSSLGVEQKSPIPHLLSKQNRLQLHEPLMILLLKFLQHLLLLDPSETGTYGKRWDRIRDSRSLPPGTRCSLFWDQRHQGRTDNWNVKVFTFLGL